MTRLVTLKGGPGSGHHGHKGRKGQRGGSMPGEMTKAMAVGLERMQSSTGKYGAMRPQEWEAHFQELGFSNETVEELRRNLKNLGVGYEAQVDAKKNILTALEEDTELGKAVREQIRLETTLNSTGQEYADTLWEKDKAGFDRDWEFYSPRDGGMTVNDTWYDNYDRAVRAREVMFDEWNRFAYRRGGLDSPIQSWSMNPGGAEMRGPGSGIGWDHRIDLGDLAAKGYSVLGGYSILMGAPGEAEITLIRNDILKQLRILVLKQHIVEKESQDGIIVAFRIDPFKLEDLMADDNLLLPDGAEPTDLNDFHLTLAHLGNTDDPPDRGAIVKALELFTEHVSSIDGVITGTAVFKLEDGGQALVALYDSPQLLEFRQALVDTLKAHDVNVGRKHGFIPHITLAYYPEHENAAVKDVPRTRLVFDDIHLFWGGKKTSFPLAGGAVRKKVVLKGGPGSGHRGHRGIPGQIGGSLPGTGFGTGDVVMFGGKRARVIETPESSQSSMYKIEFLEKVKRGERQARWAKPGSFRGEGELATPTPTPKKVVKPPKPISEEKPQPLPGVVTQEYFDGPGAKHFGRSVTPAQRSSITENMIESNITPDNLRGVTISTSSVLGQYRDGSKAFMRDAPGERTKRIPGYYAPETRTVCIHNSWTRSRTLIHEIGHHVSRMRTPGARMSIGNASRKAMKSLSGYSDSRLRGYGLRKYSLTSASEFLADSFATYKMGNQSQRQALIRLWQEHTQYDPHELFKEISIRVAVLKGGPGSGHRGHRGIPGQRGGSLPGTGGIPGANIDFSSMSKDERDEAIRNLSANDEMVMFHGTRDPDTVVRLIEEGFDPSQRPEGGRIYEGKLAPDKGFYVSPWRQVSEGFGRYVIEFQAQASTMVAPPEKGLPKGQTSDEFWSSSYPDSFRPGLSASLRMGESQGLLTGKVSPQRVKAVWMYDKADNAWVSISPSDFVERAELGAYKQSESLKGISDGIRSIRSGQPGARKVRLA